MRTLLGVWFDCVEVVAAGWLGAARSGEQASDNTATTTSEPRIERTTRVRSELCAMSAVSWAEAPCIVSRAIFGRPW
jgi:hypothetical protein